MRTDNYGNAQAGRFQHVVAANIAEAAAHECNIRGRKKIQQLPHAVQHKALRTAFGRFIFGTRAGAQTNAAAMCGNQFKAFRVARHE